MRKIIHLSILIIMSCLVFAGCSNFRARDANATRYDAPADNAGYDGVQFEGAIWTSARKEKKPEKTALYPDGHTE